MHFAIRYMKFASATYRTRVGILEQELSRMEPIPENCDDVRDVPRLFDALDEKRTLAKYTGISSQDIWIGRVRESKNPVLPYFIAIDRENHAIVLTIRGSWNVTRSIPNFSSKCGKELYVRTIYIEQCYFQKI